MSTKRGATDEIAASRGSISATGPVLGVEDADAVSMIETDSYTSAVEATAEPVDVEIPGSSVPVTTVSVPPTAVHAIFTKASAAMDARSKAVHR